MSVTFAYGGDTVTVRNPEMGNRAEVEIYQARGRTADGLPLITDKGITVERFYLEWTELSTAKKDEILAFFASDKVNGSANIFTYTDHDAVAHSVRLMNDRIETVEYFDGVWSVSMVLEVDTGS